MIDYQPDIKKRSRRNPVIKWILPVAVCIFAFTFSLFLIPETQQSDQNSAWVTSGDPCFQVKQMQKSIKESGADPSYLKCIPLTVEIIWSVEESYKRHRDYGTDRAEIFLFDRFKAALTLSYNPEKRDELENFSILGPAPCCPGEIETELKEISANFLTCDKWGHNCKKFKTENVKHFEIVPQDDNFFGFMWDKNGISQGGFGSSSIYLRDGVVKEPLHFRPGIFELSSAGSLRISVKGKDSLSWKDIQEAMDEGIGFFDFPIQKKINIPVIPEEKEVHALKGSAHVRLIFGEVEEERWRITVDGWEKDNSKPDIRNKALKTPDKKLPIWVEFNWKLVGEFSIKKIKKYRLGYKGGRVVDVGGLPELEFQHDDLYSCVAVLCSKENPYPKHKIMGRPLKGYLPKDDSVKLQWPKAYSDACVLCTPKVPYLGKTPYEQRFGTIEFIDRVSSEIIPLRDGFKMNYGVSDWLRYTITLERLK
jgi:hypothetical protein